LRPGRCPPPPLADLVGVDDALQDGSLAAGGRARPPAAGVPTSAAPASASSSWVNHSSDSRFFVRMTFGDGRPAAAVASSDDDASRPELD